MSFWRRINCKHRDPKFVKNLSGDEINMFNARSVWRCSCGQILYKPDEHKVNITDPDLQAVEKYINSGLWYFEDSGHCHMPWMYTDKIALYARIQRRPIQNVVHNAITIANIEVRPVGEGMGTRIIELVEDIAKSNGMIVYVENVLSEAMRRICVKRGYTRCGGDTDECYYFIPEKK